MRLRNALLIPMLIASAMLAACADVTAPSQPVHATCGGPGTVGWEC